MDYTSLLINNGTEFSFLSPGALPFTPNPPPSNDEVTQTIFFDMSRPNATTWAANGTGLPFEVYEETDPLIWEDVWTDVQEEIEQGQGEFVDSPLLMAHSVAVIPTLGSVVDLVFVVKGNGPPHPIHKHFNPFWVIGQGTGAFNWSSVAEAYEAIPESFNLVNPPRRDGYNTPPASAATGGSWLALRCMCSSYLACSHTDSLSHRYRRECGPTDNPLPYLSACSWWYACQYVPSIFSS